ncbi:MAG: DNA-binding response regulator [Puniceicoccaceae bacterium]|nr:MAG: DNA-binding response regulator [Puniceicoccaceae bacterium]
MKTVVIIEDQTAIRDMVSEFVKLTPGFEMVGAYGDGEEGLQGCLSLQPEVVILDVGLPGLTGTEVLRALAAKLPRSKVLIFSGRATASNIRELLAAGAQGYVDKMDGFSEFRKALEIVAGGGTFIGPKMASMMRSLILDPGADRKEIPLSDRERQILQLVAESFSTKEIAARLGISVRTVDNHRTNIMRKLNLHDVAALTRYAIKHDLVALNP